MLTEGTTFGEDDYLFYGYLVDPEPRWGYILLSQIRSPAYPFVVRDKDFVPKPFSHICR